MVAKQSDYEKTEYSLNALHTMQYYRLHGGVLYYRTAKSNVEYAIPLQTVGSQRWKRYADQYFWWGLLVTILGLIYFAHVLERGPLHWHLNHLPFAVSIIVGAIQALYWARFPRTYRLTTASGDTVGIFFDEKNPQRSMEFISAVQKEIHAAQEELRS
jgi:hypothetical protein